MKVKLINLRIKLIKYIKIKIDIFIDKRIKHFYNKYKKWSDIWIKDHRIFNVKKNYKIPFKIQLKMYRNHFRSDDYIKYDFKNNDMNDYINVQERWNTREINGEYKIIFDNKNIFYEVYKNYFDIPHNIGFVRNKNIYDEFENLTTIQDILKKNKCVVLKPIIGGGGRAVHVIKSSGNRIYFDERLIKMAELKNLLESQDDSIITTFIKQHNYAKKLFPKSTNTIRVITIKDQDTNKFIIPCAVQRIGNEQSVPVDNCCSGGYVAQIDVKTGKLKKARNCFNTDILSYHPDSKEKIEGVIIPNWQLVKDRLIEVASKFPYIPFTAWDVVITEKGFSIIEGNASTGMDLFQLEHGIKNTRLGEFYAYHNVLEKKK